MDRRNFVSEALLSMVSWLVIPPFVDGKHLPQNMEICPEHQEMIMEAKKELSFHLQGNRHLASQYLEPVRYSCHEDTKTAFFILNQYGHEIEFFKNQGAIVRFRITIPG